VTDKELERIYNEAYRAVYWTAMQLLKNEADAEDVVQDSFIAFIESYSDIKDTTKATALLKRIAANKCLDRIKLSKTDNADDEFFDSVEAVPEDFLPDSIVESEDARRIVMNIIEKSLSDDVRRTLILFYFDDMSTKEIAEALGIPQGSVLRRLNFARNKIKKEVEKYEKENNTKLFSMAIPFLSKLFIKEAEQVAIKPMPVKLANLSASAKASGKDAGIKASKGALKKGTDIMNTKILVGGLAGVVAVGATVGIIAAIINYKPDTVNPDETVIEETGPSRVRSDTGFITSSTAYEFDETETETEATEAPDELTEDSIVIHMDGMTSDEVVENLFKSANVSIGMTKEDYQERFYVPEDKTLAGKKYNSTDDSWYWTFYGGISDDVRIFLLYALVSTDDDGKVKYTGQGAGVAVTVKIEDEEFCEEVFEKCIEKYESLGCTVSYDSETLVQGGRMVEFDSKVGTIKITYSPKQIVLNIPFSLLETE